MQKNITNADPPSHIAGEPRPTLLKESSSSTYAGTEVLSLGLCTSQITPAHGNRFRSLNSFLEGRPGSSSTG